MSETREDHLYDTHQIDLGSTLLVCSAGEPPLQARVLAPEAD